ncbi:hypothetical protein GW17_00025258 [Ensete ventricosum]|nr:hypothetical protein GW17_00025258 [Ensete ventricosum]
MAATLAPADRLAAPSLRLHHPSSLSRRLLLPSRLPATPLLRHRRPRVVAMAIETDGANSKPRVLVAEKLGEAGLALLKGLVDVDCSYNLSPEELRAKIALCDALIVRSGTKVGRDVFESSGGKLRVVGRAGVGIDNVDLAAATEHGCLVVNAPTANTVAAAEHGIALLTAMARNIPRSDASMKAGRTFLSF